MTVIIEDGSVVANANSYTTVVELQAFADLRGDTLPTDNAELEALLINSTIYLESFRTKYQGSMISAEQVLQWPRADVVINGFPNASDVIPSQLKSAQMQAAIESLTTDLFGAVTTGASIKKEKVDVILVEYFEGSGTSTTTFPEVEIYLKPLLSQTSPFLTNPIR